MGIGILFPWKVESETEIFSNQNLRENLFVVNSLLSSTWAHVLESRIRIVKFWILLKLCLKEASKAHAILTSAVREGNIWISAVTIENRFCLTIPSQKTCESNAWHWFNELKLINLCYTLFIFWVYSYTLVDSYQIISCLFFKNVNLAQIDGFFRFFHNQIKTRIQPPRRKWRNSIIFLYIKLIWLFSIGLDCVYRFNMSLCF